MHRLLHLIYAALGLASSLAETPQQTPDPRPWGDSFTPRSAAPAETIHVVPLDSLTGDQRIALCCLQGLVARSRPELWLRRDARQDSFWLDWHKEQGSIKDWNLEEDWKSLFTKYAEHYRGAVIADPELYRGDLIALNTAACEDLIVTTPELAQELGLEVKIDLRGRFTTYADGMRWVWETYREKLNRFLCDFRDPELVRFATFDMAFQWRGLMFWLTGPDEASLPGVDAAAELRVLEEIFSSMGRSAVCIGFPHREGGIGIGEPQGVELLSRFGIALSCNNHASNMSVLSGMPRVRLEQNASLPAPQLDREKIYISLALSDGDNQILWPEFFRGYFEHPSYGSFPLAFGIGPATHEMQPGVIDWYYRKAAKNTEFIADVSGAAYIHPQHFGSSLGDPEGAWRDYLGITNRLMEEMDLRCIRTVGGDDEVIGRFIDALPHSHSIFADMGRYSGHSGIDQLTYSLKGKPVFRSVTSWRYGKEGFLNEVHEQVGTQRPAFVNGFVHCWTFTMDDLVKIHAEAGADIEFVTPSQLADLYQQELRHAPTPAESSAE